MNKIEELRSLLKGWSSKADKEKYIKYLIKGEKRLGKLSQKDWKKMQRASHNYKIMYGG